MLLFLNDFIIVFLFFLMIDFEFLLVKFSMFSGFVGEGKIIEVLDIF